MLYSQCDISWKKANEYQVPLHINVVGFNVVFDNMEMGHCGRCRHVIYIIAQVA